MIPRSRRISRANFRKDLRQVLNSPYWTVKAGPNGLSHPRYAVVIGAGAVGSAVRRHSLKRFLLDQADKLPLNGVDMVFIVRKSAAESTRKQLSAEFDKIKHTLISYGIS